MRLSLFLARRTASFSRARMASLSIVIYGAGLLACDPAKEPKKVDPAPTPAVAKPGSDPTKAPSAKDMRAKTSDLPPAEEIRKVVNPRGLESYSGPTGSVSGVVRITGDQAPDLPEVLAKMEDKCDLSRSMFGKVFREGDGRTLADVLIAVTEYEGYVPAKGTDVPIWAKGCAWESRTIAMTYGQRLSIDGADNRPYVPEILGQEMPAQLFVLPTAPPVKLPPKTPGRKKLVDSMRLFNVAELFVLPYATVDVTGLDGKFRIDGIPVGKVKINALLPQTGAVQGEEITIEEGKVTEVDFELSFDSEAYEQREKPTPLDELPAPKQAGP